MGVYIYGIKSPKHVATVELDNGNVCTVAKYAYAYKPLYSFFDKEPRWQTLAKARLARMDNIWRKFISDGGKYPQGGVMVHGEGNDKIEIGSTVMTWPQVSSVPTAIEDCTCNKASYIGKIVRVIS
jgi:hypothetical protein